MEINRAKLLRELVGEDIDELVSYELECMYNSLKEDLEGNGLVNHSYDDDKEQKWIKKHMKAIKKVHSLYSTDKIKD